MINKKVAAVADAVRDILQQEAKELSAKQKKIAAVAGDPKKIDAEDFKKLRGEEHEITMTDEETDLEKTRRISREQMQKSHADFKSAGEKSRADYQANKNKPQRADIFGHDVKRQSAGYSGSGASVMQHAANAVGKVGSSIKKMFKKEDMDDSNTSSNYFAKIMEKVAERELDEAFPTVSDVRKKANTPQPSGAAGIKQGTRYGGGRQAPDVEPEEDDEKKPFTRMSGAHKNRRVDTKDYKKEEVEPPFDAPYKKTQGNVKDKSGAVHTPASRAKDSAQKGMKTFAQKRKELEEALSKKAPPADWIHDFVHSDNPQFAGKSTKQRQQMALAAYYAKQRNEEVEELDEISANLALNVSQARRSQAEKNKSPETLAKMKSATSSYTKRSSAERAKASQSDINKGFASDAAANRKKGLSNEEYELDEGRGPTSQIDQPFITDDSKPLQNAKDLAKSTMKRIKSEMMGKTGTSE